MSTNLPRGIAISEPNEIRWRPLPMPVSVRRWSLVVAGLGLAPPVNAQDAPHAHGDLGRVTFAISCSAAAQTEFNTAVALLHHMTYPQARQAFEQVARTDPKCAMAHWGVAMTLFQPLWPTRPSPAERRRGWEAAERARALAPPTERERLFVAAIEAFFREPDSADYWERIQRWEQAMQRVHAAAPDDPEAAAFYALAHLAAAPAGQYAPDRAERAAALLLEIYERNPEHPGAMHYLIHANDMPGRERESLQIVQRYDAVAPRNPHALHMPTHLYARLGDWNAVIDGNINAATAALEHPAGENGDLVWDEYPHAIEYLIYAYLQQGADDSASVWLQRLQRTERLQPTLKTAFNLVSTRARYALERRTWVSASRIVPRRPESLNWDRFTWPEAIAWFARGFGSAHSGELDETQRSVAQLRTLERRTRESGEELFARQIGILRLELEGWLAQAQGQDTTAVAHLREAAELEASTPKHAVTPAPTLPALELLGDLFLAQKQPAQALTAYRHSLELYPRRYNSVHGAARAALAAGDSAVARQYYQELVDLAGGHSKRTSLAEARAFLAHGRTP